MIDIALDPGKWCLPFCIAQDGELVAAGLSVLTPPGLILEDLARLHSDSISRRLKGLEGPRRAHIEQLSLNSGRDSTRGKAIATGNDLLELTSIAALVAGHVNAPVTYWPVGVWKGSCKKEVTKARVLATLSAKELAIFDAALTGVRRSLWHNLFDAAGILLCATNRYVVRRGYAR